MMFLISVLLWIFALAVLQRVRAEDTVSSGNYLITRCNSGLPDSEASKLQNLLPQVYDGLQRVIADLQLGTVSKHGYGVFFKDDSSKAEVLQVYQKIAAGASVLVGRPNTDTIYSRHPTFICANNNPETDLLYQICIKSPQAPLMTWLYTELIPLCPVFWVIKETARLSDCPLVVANTLTPNDDRLLQNQEALLIGSLVHFYHEHSPDMISLIGDALELSAPSSLKNPPNYALYYAGEGLMPPTLAK